MCGIIYTKNLTNADSVNSLLSILYQNQKERGTLGFGMVGLNKNSIDLYRATDEKDIKNYILNTNYDEILFHHRLPTSTKNTIETTHPFKLDYKDKTYYFVHNGIIENAIDIWRGHLKQGIKYTSQTDKSTFNDSEALAWDFVLWLEDNKKIEAIGSVAFICLEVDKNNHAQKLYFYRNNGNPLKMYRDKNLLVLASEGEYEEVKQGQVYYFDYADYNIKKLKKLDIKYHSYYNFYEDYEDYKYTGKGYKEVVTKNDKEIEDLVDYINEEEENLIDLEAERELLLSEGRLKEVEKIEAEIRTTKNNIELLNRELDTFYSNY